MASKAVNMHKRMAMGEKGAEKDASCQTKKYKDGGLVKGGCGCGGMVKKGKK